MPAAAKPMGMIMDVTVSCARGKGGRRSGGSVCVFCETRGGKFSRAQRQAEHRVRRAVGALRARGVFVPEPPVKRGRGGRTSDEPRKWTYPFAAWMACVFERGGEVSARSRREARARGVRGARIPRLYDAQSGVASNISLRMGGRAGSRPSGGGGGERLPSGRRRRSEASLLRKTRAWDARL